MMMLMIMINDDDDDNVNDDNNINDNDNNDNDDDDDDFRGAKHTRLLLTKGMSEVVKSMQSCYYLCTCMNEDETTTKMYV